MANVDTETSTPSCRASGRNGRKYLLFALVNSMCVFLVVQWSNLSCAGRLSLLLQAENQKKDTRLDEDRKYRFPSVEERVKVYMSNWYLPPCDLIKDSIVYDDSVNETFYLVREAEVDHTGLPRRNDIVVPTKIRTDALFAVTKEELSNCTALYQSLGLRFFCKDLQSSVYDAGLYSYDNASLPPLFVQFGDHAKCMVKDATTGRFVKNPAIPLLQKMRRSLSPQELERATSPTMDGQQCVSSRHSAFSETGRQGQGGETRNELQPIVWLLTYGRHFGPIETVEGADRPWKDKMSAAVFRGTLSGQRNQNSTETAENHYVEVCHSYPRCRLVLHSGNSTLIDAKLTKTRDLLPTILNGVNLTGSRLTQSELLAYKGCIVIEGNDVATGLKWMLYSNSVVLMPPPEFTSWAMEELLKPWVHYIPLHPDLSDVEEKVQWMIDHDTEAEQIACRGKLWISDLLHHPDAATENALINKEIIGRYMSHFRPRPSGK